MELPKSPDATGAETAGKVWIVTAPSAYRPMHTCFLGRGLTKELALRDAYGPRPWGPHQKKTARVASVYQVSEREADELQFDGA